MLFYDWNTKDRFTGGSAGLFLSKLPDSAGRAVADTMLDAAIHVKSAGFNDSLLLGHNSWVTEFQTCALLYLLHTALFLRFLLLLVVFLVLVFVSIRDRNESKC